MFFFVLSIVFLLCSFFCKKTKLSLFLAFLACFFTLICTKNGPDYEAYFEMFSTVQSGSYYHHGEIGFQNLMKLSSFFMSYNGFRVLYLSVLFLGLFFVIYKRSENPLLSIFIAVSSYITYLISAIRQFTVMIIFLLALSFLVTVLNKKTRHQRLWIVAILIFQSLAFFIHKSTALLCLIFLLVAIIVFERDVGFLRKHWLSLVVLSLACRLLLYLTPNPFDTLLLSYNSKSLFDAGLVSRLLIFGTINSLAPRRQTRFNKVLYVIWYLSILLYAAMPYSLFIGRLTNATKFVDIIFIANIVQPYLKGPKCIWQKRLLYAVFVLFIISGTLLYQVVYQPGYESFISILP